jgi:putative transposase
VGRTPWSAADPLVGFFREKSGNAEALSGVTFYRRRLPHLSVPGQPVFLTWRLDGSLPPNREFPGGTLSSGEAFVAMDRLLDEAQSGPVYLRQPAVADMVMGAIRYNADVLRHYELHAFVIMPNHVHLLATPAIPLPRLTKSLKGITAKRANELRCLTGVHFWQEESYDHLVRSTQEFRKIRRYIEENPARAGLAKTATTLGQARLGRPGGRPRTRGSAPQLPLCYSEI